MATCPNIPRCPLYPMLDLRTLAGMKEQYCEGSYERCARIKRGKEKPVVPMNLLPDGNTLRAEPASR